MRRALLAAATAALLALLPLAGALAHPLGSFTVNRYTRVEVGPDEVRLLHVLDVAEIPSVQERQAADLNRDGTLDAAEQDAYRVRKAEEARRDLDVAVDGHALALTVDASDLELSSGQAGLPLIRLEVRLRAALPPAVAASAERSFTLRDRAEPARMGWREVVVRTLDGARLTRSSVPSEDLSNALRAYPDDRLQDPLDVRQATWASVPHAGATAPLGGLALAAQREAAGRPTDAFAALVAAPDLTPAVVLLAVLASAVLGGIHAASPGHGKTVMAAYLVGTRGTLRHALALALSVTVSHTAGVLVLGGVTVLLSNVLFPEQVYPWLTLASGVVVLAIGLGLLGRAARGTWTDHGGHEHGPEGHDHVHGLARGSRHAHPDRDPGRGPGRDRAPSHGHGGGASHSDGHGLESHGRDHDHKHGLDRDDAHKHGLGHAHGHSGHHHHDLPLTWRGLVALGLAGGLVPSASALVVLLSALALGRLGFGLLLIVAFGAGMAVVLCATGVALVYAGRLLARLLPDGAGAGRPARLAARAAPVLSALVMALVGAVVTLQALAQVAPTLWPAA